MNLAGAQVPGALGPELAGALGSAIDEAFVSSFRVAMLAGSGLAFGGSLVSLSLIRYRREAEATPAD